jgi:ferredoxin
MVTIFDDFSYEISPRGVIEAVLVEGDIETLSTDRFWYCLTCDLCTDLCPAGVRFRDFVQAFRHLALESGVMDHGSFCRNCGTYLQPQRVTDYMDEALGKFTEEFLTLCPTCRKYDLAGKIKTLGSSGEQVFPTPADPGAGR